MRFSKKEEYLRQKDKKLKKIIETNGHIDFKPVKKNQFDTLVGIVISQFISTKAANSIFKNMRENFNSKYLNEKHFQELINIHFHLQFIYLCLFGYLLVLQDF